jgi:hypothetical protein
LCAPNQPGFELAFESVNIVDTGLWRLPVGPPRSSEFLVESLGRALHILETATGFRMTGFAADVAQFAGHSFTLWFTVDGTTLDDTLIDFSTPCAVGAPAICGASVSYVTAPTPHLHFFFGTTAGSQTTDINIAVGTTRKSHSIVVTEQKVSVDATQSMTIFVDGGSKTTLSFTAGNVYAVVNDTVSLPHTNGTIVDEYQFWPRDLTTDSEMLCENGFDGQFDPVAGTCVLTAN